MIIAAISPTSRIVGEIASHAAGSRHSPVCAVAFSVLRDRARSEEVAQDAFVIAWQQLANADERPQCPGWLCGIARNLARNAARKHKETAMDTVTALDPASTTPSPLEAILDRETGAQLRRALAELPDDDREVLVTYYRGDENSEQVAAALGLPPAAVRKRLERARTRLRDSLTSIERGLRATRPSPAFTAACVAAFAAGAGTRAARASVVGPSARNGSAGASWLVAAAIEKTIGPAPTSALARIDATARGELLDHIARVRHDRAPDRPYGTPSNPKIYDFAGGRLDDLKALPAPATIRLVDKATLRYALATVQPLLLECSNAERDRAATGHVEVTVRLVGDPEVATVVERADVTGDVTPSIAECMRESLLSIELPASDDDVTVEVHYPYAIGGG